MTETYSDSFYMGQADASALAAKRVIPVLLSLMPELKSAVDIGCGVGTWLSICLENNFTKVVGVDGEYVNKDLLRIPEESFIASNLSNDFVSLVNDKFDLAISLEVAEHLPEDKADFFVESLTSFSDVVLFSAAIPHQGGISHINEQWPEYWAEKFKKQGYYPLDIIRPLIWDDSQIVDHYRQNIIVYATKDVISGLFDDYDFDADLKLSVTHPELLFTLYKRGGELNPIALTAKSAIHIFSSLIPVKEKRREFRRVYSTKISRILYPSHTKRPVMYPTSAEDKVKIPY